MKLNENLKASLRISALGSLGFGLLVLTACAPKIVNFTPEQGDAGTEVTIEGKRFKDTAAENTVKFAGVTVPTVDITYASETLLKAKVPVGAGTGLISVTTSRGIGYSDKNFIVPRPTKWTFMVYLDGDNNLESAGIDDFLEMASVGSSTEVNIVVQMDRRPGYTSSHGDWTGTKRFLVQKNDTPSTTPIEDLGEQNMGDPAVLQDFVEWTITNYPADHYALIIWNHGGGWREAREQMMDRARAARSRGEADTAVARAVAWDDTSGHDPLYIREVQDALEAAKSGLEERLNMVVKLDIVGFDACFMGMVEVAYALRNVANYVVGSEETEPNDGWPYDGILNNLFNTPTADPESLADWIVTEYANSYPGNSGTTQSAVDISKLNNLVVHINAFTIKANTEWSNLNTARSNSQQYHVPYIPDSYWGVDLWDFADKVINQVASADIKTAATNLKNAIDDFVIKEAHSPDKAGSHGIALYFPPNLSTFNNDPDHTGYEDSNTFMVVDFVKYNQWDNWLQDFYSNL